MNKIKQNYEEILELVFKISYLCLAFATFISVIYMSPVQPILVKLTLVLGMLTIIVRVLHWKKYGKMPCLILMILFCLSFLLSIVMNRQYGGMVTDLKWLIWTGIQFFGLYVCDLEREEEKYKREFTILSHIFIIVTVIAAVASLVMMAKSYSAFLTTADEEFIITGFQWDRLWGVYTDPNYGAVCSVIGILLSGLYLIKQKRNLKILYVIAILINYAYLIFSDSRTGLLALIFCGGIFLYLWCVSKFKSKKVLKSILAVVCVFAVVFPVGETVKMQNITYQKQVAAKKAKNQPKENHTKKKELTEREKHIQDDASSGRLDIWKSAIEIWQTSPVYGAGYSTVVPYAKEHVPETFIVNNGQGDYTSMHNAFFNVLAFQGGIGFVLFVLIAVRIILYILKVLLKETENWDYVTAFLCVCTAGISMLFLLDGIYTNSPSAFVLWAYSGVLVQHVYRKRK